MQRERYKRQMVLPEIGEAGQTKLARASVLVVGAGGLGCPALLYLAAAGVGHIGIIDFDAVEESNLQRQVLFGMQDLGYNKAQAAAVHLAALNPTIEIEAIAAPLDAGNAVALFERFDLVIDGTDNFATKFLINDAAVKRSTPFIYGSILGFEGQVAVFGAGDHAPCYRCLFPEPPKGHIPNCAEAGVIGAVAGIVGTAQAMEAIKLIVGHDSFRPLVGTLWVIDLRSMENRLLGLSQDPACPVCHKNKDDIMIEYSAPACASVSEIMPCDVREGADFVLIDVREGNEWDAGHIDGARHVALSWLMEGNRPDMAKDQEIVLYCQKGVRSKQAAQLLKASGFSRVQSMRGGYDAWLA